MTDSMPYSESWQFAWRAHPRSVVRRVVDTARVLAGAGGLALAAFAMLPLLQNLTQPDTALVTTRRVTTGALAPPVVEEEKPPEEVEEEEEPPELEQEDEAPPLDLSQLEAALHPGFSGNGMAGLGSRLFGPRAVEGEGQAEFSLADLDQPPRVVYQPAPALDKKLLANTPGKVRIAFIVDVSGRVQNPRVHATSNPVFDAPALQAVRRWRFTPGKRKGQPVAFRMLVPIRFPAP